MTRRKPQIELPEVGIVDISKYEPHPDQPGTRGLSEKASRALQASMERFGLADIPTVNRKTKRILGGHQRIRKLLAAGHRRIPVVFRDFDSEADERLCFIELNNPAAGGHFTAETQALLTEIEKMDPVLYAELALDDLSEYIDLYDWDPEPPVDLEGDEELDKLIEPPKKPKTKLGDLYRLGKHRLLCGDATKEDDVRRLLKHTVPLLMVTDPPYGINYDPNWRNRDLKVECMRSTGKVQADDRDNWLAAWQLFPGDVAYVWSPAGNKQMQFYGDLTEAGFQIRTQIIWAKQHFVIGRGAYHMQHEPCWYAVRKGSKAHWCGDRSQSTIWQIANACAFGGEQDDVKTYHGTQKPFQCMAKPISNHAVPDIYDPFVGSGTTIIACERLRRRAFAIDIDPAYCDVTVERWETLTGKKAKKEPR